MPSSGSYSLGEVRMLTKNRSDGEDTNGCDDSVTIFLTKKMLTSWNESSKVNPAVPVAIRLFNIYKLCFIIIYLLVLIMRRNLYLLIYSISVIDTKYGGNLKLLI